MSFLIKYGPLKIESEKEINKCKNCRSLKQDGMDESERTIEEIYFECKGAINGLPNVDPDDMIIKKYYCNQCDNNIEMRYTPSECF